MVFTKTELLDYMRGHRLAVVSSLGPRGEPQAALVGIAVSLRFEVIFDTVVDSRKHSNLLRDPRASLVFTGPSEKTLQLEGIARPVPVCGTKDAKLRSVYYEAWPDGRNRLTWPKLSYWCIAPQWARYSDFDRGPLIEEFRWP
jgi:pyridoxine/pyridoxamine 5'-phosphate oxidase